MKTSKIYVRQDSIGWWCVGPWPTYSGTMFRPGEWELALAYALRESGVNPNPLNLDPWGRLPVPVMSR